MQSDTHFLSSVMNISDKVNKVSTESCNTAERHRRFINPIYFSFLFNIHTRSNRVHDHTIVIGENQTQDAVQCNVAKRLLYPLGHMYSQIKSVLVLVSWVATTWR